MPIFVERPASPALLRRCDQIANSLKPNSRGMTLFREDLRRTVVEDHYHMLIENKDRYGQPRAPLAASTLANKKRGPGPSLIPRWFRSRFIANFEAEWTERNGAMVLACGYLNILSKQGRPFVQYHMNGTSRMPRRDTGGITPKGWANVKRLFALLPDYLRKGWTT